MTNHQSIATVTAIFSQMVQALAARAIEGTSVSTSRPDNVPTTGSASTANRVNVFLFQVGFDPHARNEDLPTRSVRGSPIRKPRAAFKLHYLVTFYGDQSVLAPERMLASVMSGMHSRPWISMERARKFIEDNQPSPGPPPESPLFEYLKDSLLDKQGEAVRFTPSRLNLEELSKLWSVFFQVPYALSTAYEASIVYVDEPEEAVEPLPVRVPVVTASGSFAPITVDRATAPDGPSAPVFADSTLTVTGSGFTGDDLQVWVDDDSQPVTQDSTTALEAPLAPFGLGAGVHLVRVGHEGGATSNPVGIVVRAKIAGTAQRTVTEGDATVHLLDVTTDVTVEIDQEVDLVLNALTGDRPSYVLAARPRSSPTTTVTAATDTVPSGPYLLRVRIDGIESALETADAPADLSYTGPKVVLA